MADKMRGSKSSKSNGLIIKQVDDDKTKKANRKTKASFDDKADKDSKANGNAGQDNQADKTGESKPKIGRPTIYTDQIGETLYYLTAYSDMGMQKVCELANVSYEAVKKWIQNKDHPFFPIYVRAKEQQTEFLVEQMVDIADTVEPRRDEIEKAKLRLDARKFVAAKLKPKKFGDKPELFLDAKPSDANTTTAETIAEKITRISELIANKPTKPTA